MKMFCFSVVCVCLGNVWLPASFGQGIGGAPKNAASHNLIRPEYYAGLDFLADGQTIQATAAFESAFANARAIDDKRGIDSVPSMVMSGECFLEQCDIAMALDKYDGALQVSLMGQRWLGLLKAPPGTVRPDSKPKDIHWAPNSRGTQMGVFTESWPIVLGASDMLLELPAGQGVVGRMLSIDALEILRCQSIALRRRYQLLGPLARHNPLDKPLLDAFSQDITGQNDAIQCAFQICHAMALIGHGDRVESARILKQNLSLSSGLDHPLTAVALLALADLAAESNDMSEAEERAIEASLVAARANQMDHLAESIEYLSQMCLANGHDATVTKVLPMIIQWAGNKGRRVGIQSQVAWARLLALTGDASGSKAHCVTATAMLLPSQVVLPRCEATIRFARAKTEFLEGKVSDGISTLYEAFAFLRGPTGGVGVPALFQLNMSPRLVQAKALADDVAEEVLLKILRPPVDGLWRSRPLEQLAWLAADKSEAFSALLDVQLRIRNEETLVATFDEISRTLYRQNFVMESRVLDLQQAFHGDGQWIHDKEREAFQRVRKQVPALVNNASKIAELIAPLQNNPKWDSRKWSEDEQRRWESAVRLSDTQESLLWATAVSPLVIPEVFPPRHSQTELDRRMQPTDAVVFFAFQGNLLRGFLLQQGKWQSWTVDDADMVQKQLNKTLSDLMALKKRDGSTSELAKHWSNKNSAALRSVLFPKEIWSQLLQSTRWVIVPNRMLWYVPFELFPVSDHATALPSLSAHKIVYSPTLGLVPRLISPMNESPKKPAVDIHMGEFFTRDVNRAKEIRDELANGKHVVVEIMGKANFYPVGRFFKIAAGRVTDCFSSNRDSIVPVPTDRNGTSSNIQSWSGLPWGTPTSLLLPGVNMMPPPAPSGDEWLRVLLPAMAQGTRHVLISRWPVGGESTAALLRSYEENEIDMPKSEAWQRSVLSLWEEQFDPRLEPIFKEAPFATPDAAVGGNHPLLWSSYMHIGD